MRVPFHDHNPLVRFTGEHIADEMATEHIGGAKGRTFGVAKIVADCFRYRKNVLSDVFLSRRYEASKDEL